MSSQSHDVRASNARDLLVLATAKALLSVLDAICLRGQIDITDAAPAQRSLNAAIVAFEQRHVGATHGR